MLPVCMLKLCHRSLILDAQTANSNPVLVIPRRIGILIYNSFEYYVCDIT